jgi:hypothetical protein
MLYRLLEGGRAERCAKEATAATKIKVETTVRVGYVLQPHGSGGKHIRAAVMTGVHARLS